MLGKVKNKSESRRDDRGLAAANAALNLDYSRALRCHPERVPAKNFRLAYFVGRAGAESKEPYSCEKSQCGRAAQQQV